MSNTPDLIRREINTADLYNATLAVMLVVFAAATAIIGVLVVLFGHPTYQALALVPAFLFWTLGAGYYHNKIGWGRRTVK